MLHTIDWRARWEARSNFCAPTAWATSTELPTESALSAEMTKNITCKELPTPAMAAAPSRATKNVSTMPSIVSRKFSPITGQARLKTRRLVDNSATGAAVGSDSGATKFSALINAAFFEISREIQNRYSSRNDRERQLP